MERASRTRRLGARAALCVALVVSTVAGSGAGSAAADPGDRLRARADTLRAQLKKINADLSEAVAKYNDARHEETNAITRGFEAAKRADAAIAAHAAASEAAAARIRSLYMSGGQLAVVATIMRAPNLHDAFSRYHNVSAVIGADGDSIDGLNAAAREAENAREAQRAAARMTVQAADNARKAAAKVESAMARQTALLEQADAELRAYIEEEARKARERAARELAKRLAAEAEAAARAAAVAGTVTAADPAAVYISSDGKYACPVGATHSFVDTWGAPRSGGRKHQGTDVFAPYGSPAYAVVDGVVDKWGNGGLGGITLWIKADNGDRFYYAHNSVNIARVGTRVKAGDIVARVGTTGNAATTPPHIHFEAHPGGGAAHNPYPFLKAICG